MTEVRRKDYQHTIEADILDFLDAQAHGFLGYVRPDGSPGMVALNYVRSGDTIYFHGSPEGEKMRSFAGDPRAVFMVADGFSLLPSFWREPERACPASQYYKAVVVRGEVRALDTRAEKAAALQALMEKLQPEGGYRPITPTDRLYTRSLDTTAVLALSMDDVTAKFKFGQNLPTRTRAGIAAKLEERAADRDIETADGMRAACPFD